MMRLVRVDNCHNFDNKVAKIKFCSIAILDRISVQAILTYPDLFHE